MFEDDMCYQKKKKAEQDKDIWSCWGWLVCHFKQGGQVSFIEEAIFYIKLRGGKRVIIHASIEEGELSGRRKKMTACLVGLRNRKETSVSGIGDDIKEILEPSPHRAWQIT